MKKFLVWDDPTSGIDKDGNSVSGFIQTKISVEDAINQERCLLLKRGLYWSIVKDIPDELLLDSVRITNMATEVLE